MISHDLAAKDLRTLDHTRPTLTTVPHTPQTHHDHVSTQQSVSNRSNWLEPGLNHHREIMLPCQCAPNGVTSPSTAKDAMCLTCQVQGLPARTFHASTDAAELGRIILPGRQLPCVALRVLRSGRCLEVRRGRRAHAGTGRWVGRRQVGRRRWQSGRGARRRIHAHRSRLHLNR